MADQEKEGEENPNIKREDWNVGKVADESVNKSADETLRQVLRGDESKGDPDERDIVGSSDSIDTPQGREEAKTETEKNS